MIGESGVGKTSLIQRFINNQYDENFLPTIAIDFKMEIITVNEKKVKL